MPDLAAVLAAATLFYCLFLFGAPQSLFRDSDTGWHIRTGEQILASHVFPTADPYSFSKPGAAWFAWEWGSDVLMAVVYRAAGFSGLAALFAVAIAAVTWLWTRLHFVMGGDFFLAGAFAPLMVTVTSAHWLARPHVFGWLFSLLLFLYLERTEASTAFKSSRAHQTSPTAKTRHGAAHEVSGQPASTVQSRVPKPFHPAARKVSGHFLFIALFTSLWANLHASFFLAPALCALYAATHHKRARFYLTLAFASLAGSLLNPFGWRLHQHVASYLFDSRLTAQIAEFQPFDFRVDGAVPFVLAIALTMIGAGLALRQRQFAHAALAAGLLVFSLRSARMLPLLALLALPIANAAITQALRGVRSLRGAFAYSGSLLRIDRSLDGRIFLAILTPLLLVCLAAPAFSRTAGFPSADFPVAAANAVADLPPAARILSTDKFGGYLIYRFSGARPVFFDGRSDFYGADFLAQYGRLTALQPGWRDTLARYRFTHALLPAAAPLAAALEHDGWRVLYRDSVATLLEAR